MCETLAAPIAALQQVAGLLGGQAGVAAGLGFKDRRNVWPWFNTGRPVPTAHCPALERLCAGAVPCEALRPDVAWVRVPDDAWPWHPQGRPLIDVTVARLAEEVRDAA